MATIRNPYVTPAIRGANGGFLDPGIGALFNDLGAGINAANAGSRNDANEAVAALNRAKTQGQLDTNQAMRTAPETLAAIFANGGVLNDSQTQMPADWEARLNQAQAPLDYSATPSRPDTKTISSVFATEGMSAKEQMGLAIQEALARGVNIGDIAKFFGQGGYLKAANSDRPEDGMKFMPLFGAAANQNTAITERQQDKLEGNQANRAFGVANINAGSALAVVKQQGVNQRDLATHKQPFDAQMEQYKQDGRLRLKEYEFNLREDGVVTSAKPSQVPIISSKLTDGIRTGIATRAKEAGIVFEGGSENSILAEVLKRYQDPKLIGNGYKNPTVALDSVIEDLQAGQFAKLQQGQEPPAGGWTSFSNLFRGKDNKVGGRTTFNFAPGSASGTALSPTSPEAAPAIERPTRPAAPAFTMPTPAAPAAAVTPPAPATRQMRKDPGALDDARRSIANGAARDKVLERLQQLGIDSTGL